MQYSEGSGNKVIRIVSTVAVIIAVVIMSTFTILDLLIVNNCSMCREVTMGKQDAIADKPVCERCYSLWNLERGIR